MANHEVLSSERWTNTLSFAGSPQAGISSHIFVVTPQYFETLGMTVVRGRGLTPRDREGAPRVAVLNETLAHQAFGGEDPIGRRLRHGFASDGDPADIEVVGVVRDARISGPRERPKATVYHPYAQLLDASLEKVQVRAEGDPARLAEQVRGALRSAHPALRITNVRTMTNQVEFSLRNERLLAMLATAFGATALFLVCLGLYGVISRWAQQRSREIGLRMALGASAPGVRWLVLRQALGLVLAGVALGIPLALAAARLLENLLYGLSPSDPMTLVLASSLMLAVAAIAAYLPARRAARVDPMVALRAE
jgi:predicted permease